VNEPKSAPPSVVYAPIAAPPKPTATTSERPESPRALVQARLDHGDTTAFDEVVRVQRLVAPAETATGRGERPFDPDQLARLFPVERWLPLAEDPSLALRGLVAAVLSSAADPTASETLIRLVKDSEIEVARQAIWGLARLPNQDAHEAMLAC
jgi:hypothetical protein